MPFMLALSKVIPILSAGGIAFLILALIQSPSSPLWLASDLLTMYNMIAMDAQNPAKPIDFGVDSDVIVTSSWLACCATAEFFDVVWSIDRLASTEPNSENSGPEASKNCEGWL